MLGHVGRKPGGKNGGQRAPDTEAGESRSQRMTPNAAAREVGRVDPADPVPGRTKKTNGAWI